MGCKDEDISYKEEYQYLINLTFKKLVLCRVHTLGYFTRNLFNRERKVESMKGEHLINSRFRSVTAFRISPCFVSKTEKKQDKGTVVQFRL